jgi:hypothetical protein
MRPLVLERLADIWHGHDPAATPRDPFATNAYLDICPPSLRDPSASEPERRVSLRPEAPAEPSATVPSGTRGDRPLVYLTLGTYVFGTWMRCAPPRRASGRSTSTCS